MAGLVSMILLSVATGHDLKGVWALKGVLFLSDTEVGQARPE